MFSTTSFNCILNTEDFFLQLEKMSQGFWSHRFPKIGLFYLLLDYIAQHSDACYKSTPQRVEDLREFLGASRLDILIEPMHELLHVDGFILACIDFIDLFEKELRVAHAGAFAEPMMFPTITILEWRGLNLFVGITARVFKHESHS